MAGDAFPYPEYLENIIRQLNRYFRWTGADLTAQVGFEIQRDGSVKAIRVHPVAEDLGRTHRAEVEDLARTVGVKAALPLGVCLLPAFLLVGIVPVVVASLAALGW